jgi:hypothetical protein
VGVISKSTVGVADVVALKEQYRCNRSYLKLCLEFTVFQIIRPLRLGSWWEKR